MAHLYLTEQGSVLRKTGDRLLVEKDDVTLLDVHCHELDTVLIFGNVQFTTQAIHELFEHGIELALLTFRGKLIGQLTPIMPKNIKLRMAQYERTKEPEFTLRVAKTIVSAKISNSLTHIKKFSYSHKEKDFSSEMARIIKSLKSVDTCQTIDQLRGVEGAAAKAYFQGFSKMILVEGLPFTGRKKRPAPDPVNALLSFGYTLLFNEINSLLDGVGFDPYIGVYHQIDYGRPSLACDLIEEFRAPVIDRFTLSLLNNRVLNQDDFYLHQASGGMYLQKKSLKTYLASYERFMLREFSYKPIGQKTTIRQVFRYQAQRMSETITTGTDYQSYLFKA